MLKQTIVSPNVTQIQMDSMVSNGYDMKDLIPKNIDLGSTKEKMILSGSLTVDEKGQSPNRKSLDGSPGGSPVKSIIVSMDGVKEEKPAAPEEQPANLLGNTIGDGLVERDDLLEEG